MDTRRASRRGSPARSRKLATALRRRLAGPGLGLAIALGTMSAASCARNVETHTAAPELAGKYVEVPVTVHVAHFDGEPVVDRAKMIESIARANRELRPHGVFLSLQSIERLEPGHQVIAERDDRAELAEFAPKDGTVHVFWVKRVELGNRRHGDRRVSGLHWHYGGPKVELRDRQYLVVASDAPLTTFVHEVGHAFGLGHHWDRKNIMCSCERKPDPIFNEGQGHQLRTGAYRFPQIEGAHADYAKLGR